MQLAPGHYRFLERTLLATLAKSSDNNAQVMRALKGMRGATLIGGERCARAHSGANRPIPYFTDEGLKDKTAIGRCGINGSRYRWK